MRVNIFTDPHLGVSRQAHTTRESSQRLNQALFRAALSARSKDLINVIAGDLFDRTNNPEWVTVQGIRVATDALVLEGNHDATNRAETKSSLDVVDEAGVAQIIQPESLDKPCFENLEGLYFVPHHATQELFDTALEEARACAKQEEGHTYLFVHCNRHSVPGERADSTLVLEKDKEAALLQTFTRIFYGHIHQPNHSAAYGEDVLGRVVVLGNTHPTSFADISNKYRYELDTDTDTLTAYLIWDESRYGKLTLGGSVEYPNAEFIEVRGEGTRKEVSDFISMVWEANPRAYAIRPNVDYLTDEGKLIEQVDLSDLGSIIRGDLEGSDLIDLYKDLEKELAQ